MTRYNRPSFHHDQPRYARLHSSGPAVIFSVWFVAGIPSKDKDTVASRYSTLASETISLLRAYTSSSEIKEHCGVNAEMEDPVIIVNWRKLHLNLQTY